MKTSEDSDQLLENFFSKAMELVTDEGKNSKLELDTLIIQVAQKIIERGGSDDL